MKNRQFCPTFKFSSHNWEEICIFSDTPMAYFKIHLHGMSMVEGYIGVNDNEKLGYNANTKRINSPPYYIAVCCVRACCAVWLCVSVYTAAPNPKRKKKQQNFHQLIRQSVCVFVRIVVQSAQLQLVFYVGCPYCFWRNFTHRLSAILLVEHWLKMGKAIEDVSWYFFFSNYLSDIFVVLLGNSDTPKMVRSHRPPSFACTYVCFKPSVYTSRGKLGTWN